MPEKESLRRDEMEALILFSSFCVIGFVGFVATWLYDRNHHRPQHS